MASSDQNPAGSETSVIVLCPMQVEHAAIARAVSDAYLQGVRVVQTGIGKEAILRTLEREIPGSRLRLAVLAGACGALRHVQDVPRISGIVDEHGHSWTPVNADPGGVVLVAVDVIASTPADKKALAERTGAAIVDMEAHAFAEWCREIGLAAAVVRGVSDTPEETMPAQVINWITPEGGTKTVRAVWDMLLHPRLIPHISAVLKRSKRVLPQVGDEVVRVVREFMKTSSVPATVPLAAPAIAGAKGKTL